MIDKFLQAPLANSLAVIVLITLIVSWFTSLYLALQETAISLEQGGYIKLMLVIGLLGIPAIIDLLQTQDVAFLFALTASLALFLSISILFAQIVKKLPTFLPKNWSRWLMLVLVIGGLAVAGYFTFIEFTARELTCGPITGCGDVQNSPYAILFGVIPMGIFGLVGYIAILVGWLLWQYGPIEHRKFGALALWGLCIFGVLFSTYLTFLEPFVIGATCMWCISSAIFMILLLLASTPAAQQALTINTN